jgi:hypothetical protein
LINFYLFIFIYFIFYLIGLTTVGGVNISSFDADYKASLEGSMEVSLNEGTGGGATVSVTGAEESAPAPAAGRGASKGAGKGTGNDEGTGNLRRVLPSAGVLVSYDVTVNLEQYGTDAESVFGVVDETLVDAQQSSALQDNMNEKLVELKGSGASIVTVEEIVNDEESVVITELKTAGPTVQPTVAPSTTNVDDSNKHDDGILLIIVAVVVVVAFMACACGSYYFLVFNKQETETNIEDIAVAEKVDASTLHYPPEVSEQPGATAYASNEESAEGFSAEGKATATTKGIELRPSRHV